MTIWLMALLCVGLAGYAGYARGIIRVAMSLFGILLGLWLAPLLGPVLAPVMRMMISNVLLADVLAPLAVFLIVSIGMKAVAAAVHNKVEVHFRYKATDTKLLHYERIISRLGGSLGLLNGTLYFYVLCTALYVAGYLTMQVTNEENATGATKLINRVSADLNTSGMQRAIVAIDPMPPAYYDLADVTGHIFHNRLLMSRAGRYPFFLGLAERPEIQDIAADPQANELIQTEATLGKILAHPKIKALLSNAAIIDELKQLDAADLKIFVETGKSPKYEPTRILGSWTFDISATLEQTRLAQPNITPKRMLELTRELGAAFLEASLVATTDGRVFIKASPPAPPLQPGQPVTAVVAAPVQNVGTGTWTEAGGVYTVTIVTTGAHALYQFLKGTAKVRFLDNAALFEFGDKVLGFTQEL